MIIIQLNEQEQSHCHCCGKQLAGAESAVDTTKYYGQTSPNEAYTAKVLLPICGECKNRQKKRGVIIWTIMVILGLPPVITTIMQVDSLFDLCPLVFVGILVAFAAVMALGMLEKANGYKSISDYPVHDILTKYKWNSGDFKPDENSKGHPEIEDTLRDMLAELESQGYHVEESPYNDEG